MMVMAQGSSFVPGVNISDQSWTNLGPTTLQSRSGYSLNNTGVVQRQTAGTFSTVETWLLSGAVGDYEARATITSGPTGTGNLTGTTGSWLNLGTTRTWVVQDTTDGITDPYAVTLLIEIRNATTLVVHDTATVYLEANFESI